MERRALVKNLFVLGMTASLPLKTLFARQHSAPLNVKRPFHRFQLGELELTTITDGHLVIAPVQPAFAPNAAAAEVEGLLKASFRSTKEIDLSMNILAIRKGKQVILVDSGAGYSFGSGCGWLPQSLSDAGISPEEVTDIILSHAHTDHSGGLIKKDGSLVFPNAQIYLSAVEHRFWMSDHPDFSKAKFDNKDQLNHIIAETKKIFTTVKDRLKLFDHPTELFGCIRLELAAGHTPGHTLVHVFSGSEEIVHIADLMHSDVLLFPHPEWGFYGDTDFTAAAATRKKVLQVLAEKKAKVFAYHLPWPGIGHVRKQDKGFEWIPETYSFPA
ncbi:MBL fold metallo-hydrolase [Chitinophaga nivalis]|uniref:MBL fold metallo-hydrolase n=1 Tax=Chitinophaga nivalis TaxID=2991709 RepID=A0ABT3ITP7_9BACT|nr:MBL fold metallo-hydrolase [Chitinophaga nivalis]MCW3463044.1 MBL fold metallo-hydrolase [Chitinophaga nivalis]MCW3487266.1 MBL fold metallo-hydrolase [Chitinophaga nivalis]